MNRNFIEVKITFQMNFALSKCVQIFTIVINMIMAMKRFKIYIEKLILKVILFAEYKTNIDKNINIYDG